MTGEMGMIGNRGWKAAASTTFRLAIGVLLLARSAAAVPTNAEIQRILRDRIDAPHKGAGIVVGVIEPKGRRIIGHAFLSGDTVFEIGSLTKVFTTLLLADAVRRGEVALADPASKYLPANVRMPERGGRKITLLDLATHTSGLPDLPSNIRPKNAANPYADYSIRQLYEFLSSCKLPRTPGSRYEYSSLGVALLGQILSLRAGMDYETLLRTRITEPLSLENTAITLTAAQRRRLTAGHNAKGKPVPNWDLPAFAGSGAVKSTANDLLDFLAAQLGYVKSPLAPAMASQLAVRRQTGTPHLLIALGWHILSMPGGQEIICHNGGTGGYRAYIAYDPKTRVGIVVLSNMSAAVDDLGRQLLAREGIAVAPALLQSYVGVYVMTPTFILTVTRSGNRLFVRATGQQKYELFAESDRKFFLNVGDARIIFVPDKRGRATKLVLQQNGKDLTAFRIK